MTHRVGPKGQVVIPKDLRKELGIEPGDDVIFWRHGDHVAVRPSRVSEPLRGRFSGSTLTDDLLAERDAERRRACPMRAPQVASHRLQAPHEPSALAVPDTPTGNG